MKLRHLFSAFIMLLALQVKATSVTSINAFLPQFEDLIHQSMKEKKVPGLAVAIVKDGKIIYMKGFGVRTVGEPEPVNTHTVFQIGSASKAITSVLVAILLRDKILHLDHPVETIPDTTLRHVLSHTTGIPSAGFNSLIEKDMPTVDVYKALKETAPESLPGQQFAYHNVVYSLAGDIIESQTKSSFEQALQSHLFNPLHMKETSSTWDTFIARPNRVSVHTFTSTSDQEKKGKKNKKGKKEKKGTKEKKEKPADRRVLKVPYRQGYANFPAAAGMSSTIHDMALFLAAILGGRPDVVSPADLEPFIKPLIHTPDQWYRSRNHRDRITETHYGLGWRMMTFGGHHLVFHGGWIRGISSLISFIPEKGIGIVILQNAESALPFALSMQFYDWVLDLPPKTWIE